MASPSSFRHRALKVAERLPAPAGNGDRFASWRPSGTLVRELKCRAQAGLCLIETLVGGWRIATLSQNNPAIALKHLENVRIERQQSKPAAPDAGMAALRHFTCIMLADDNHPEAGR